MPLANRVDPFGEIHAVSARGMFTGNRGVIHDPATKTLLRRRWSTKAWLICACEFRGRRREVMGRNAPSGNAGWTELFFLDEVTALAAGHRPCFHCRREKAQEFADCFAKAFGIAKPEVAKIDARLHAERLASGGKRMVVTSETFALLPDGAMLAAGDAAWATRHGGFQRWSFSGYEKTAGSGNVLPDSILITPATTIAVLLAGYEPQWRPTGIG